MLYTTKFYDVKVNILDIQLIKTTAGFFNVMIKINSSVKIHNCVKI